MAAFLAYPELRHPFEAKPIHAEGSTSVLYQGRQITLTETGSGTDSNQKISSVSTALNSNPRVPATQTCAFR